MNKNVLGKRKTPLGVKIISILYILGAVLMTVMGILMILSSAAADPFLQVYMPSATGVNVQVGDGFFITGGIFAIAVAMFGVLVALGLWMGKNWARTIALVLSGLGVISAFLSMPIGLIALVIHGLILWYLGFRKGTVVFFK